MLSLAAERQDGGTLRALTGTLDRFSIASEEEKQFREQMKNSSQFASMSTDLVSPVLASVLPLHPIHGLRSDVVQVVEYHAQMFDAVLSGQRPAGRLFRDDELATFVFSWHRRRSIDSALKAMAAERVALGDRFDADALQAREIPYILVSEAAGLMSYWLPNEGLKSSLTAIATALRSAYWLWLEDDDRAMAVLRSVLEHTARMRTWRRNPTKAERLDNLSKATPRDWLDAAGWRRLEALNRALGEFVHSRITSRWHGARELLAALQLNVDDDMSIQTARGSCLDLVVSLLCQELVATVDQLSNTVSDALRGLFAMHGRIGDAADRNLEELIDHIWSHRKTVIGDVTLQGPALAWERGEGPSGLNLVPQDLANLKTSK